MKKLLPILVISTLALTGCSNSNDEEPTITQEAAEPTTATQQSTTESKEQPAAEGDINSEIGKRHGGMCDGDIDNCEVNFTIDNITKLDTCDAEVVGERPEGTNLYRVDSTVTANADIEVDPNHEPSDFLWASQWSTLTSDGANMVLNFNQECISPDPVGFMWGDIRRGDTQKYTMYFNIPEDAEGLRMTVNPNRWVWELPA